jgi:hypothetical protein
LVGDLLEDAVEVFDDGGGTAELVGAEAEGDGERGHEERGGGAFAGDVGDDDVDDGVGDGIEVVVVAAEETGGLHGGGELDARYDGRFGKDLTLNLGGEGEVALVVVTLLTDFGGEAATLLRDAGDEEADDEITGETDDGANDSDVGAVGGAEEVLQVGA